MVAFGIWAAAKWTDDASLEGVFHLFPGLAFSDDPHHIHTSVARIAYRLVSGVVSYLHQ
jgi:hypothetical protein